MEKRTARAPGQAGNDPEPCAARLMAQREMLSECAATTRRACEEMIRLIDAGSFSRDSAGTQFGWLYTLKNRRELILTVLNQLDGRREDRTGQSTRAAADKRWKG